MTSPRKHRHERSRRRFDPRRLGPSSGDRRQRLRGPAPDRGAPTQRRHAAPSRPRARRPGLEPLRLDTLSRRRIAGRGIGDRRGCLDARTAGALGHLPPGGGGPPQSPRRRRAAAHQRRRDARDGAPRRGAPLQTRGALHLGNGGLLQRPGRLCGRARALVRGDRRPLALLPLEDPARRARAAAGRRARRPSSSSSGRRCCSVRATTDSARRETCCGCCAADCPS